MNPIAYRTTGMAIKTLSNLSKAKVNLHGTENIIQGSKIFVINHFTRLETFLMPYYLHKLIKMPVWSLAAANLFIGTFGRYLTSVGAVATNHPDRDRLIVKTLLTNEAAWIIFPEGRMVKSKKIIEKGRYIVSYAGGKHAPHTGAAFLGLRTEFYRQRLNSLVQRNPDEVRRLLPLFNLNAMEDISNHGTYLVPVNLTYYPLRAKYNILNRLAEQLVEGVPERIAEELMTEGAMLLSGVDIDIRFGEPIEIGPYLQDDTIQKDIHASNRFNFDDLLPSLKCIRKAALNIMQRYMEAIYSMVTVNHDHIFASLLKHSPTNRINLDDFRRRAFLAVTRAAKQNRLPVHLHQSLKANQNHLLIDDGFEKLLNFLTLATEKEVIQQHQAFLIRNRPKLRRIFDFHSVRINNPIAVMANEVEPLTLLQNEISRLSWQPSFWLRHKISHYFKKKAEQEFEQDYHSYFLNAESKPQHIGKPRLMRARSHHVGVVLCHGYMAAPAEVLTLAKYLNRKGFWVYTPRLKGHGTSPEDLARCKYQDWIESIEQGYLLIRNQCRHVLVGGFSTGAGLALELATRVRHLAGVFAVSTPLRLQYLSSRLAPVVDTWNRFVGKIRWEEAQKTFVKNRSENPHINYERNPISGVRELERLMDFVEPKLSLVTVPALVVQSQNDPVVHPKGSERIFSLLGSQEKQYLVFNFNRHGILSGKGSEQVHSAIGTFIDQCLKKESAPQPNIDEAETEENIS